MHRQHKILKFRKQFSVLKTLQIEHYRKYQKFFYFLNKKYNVFTILNIEIVFWPAISNNITSMFSINIINITNLLILIFMILAFGDFFRVESNFLSV